MKFYDQELADLILDLAAEVQFSIDEDYQEDRAYFQAKLDRAHVLAARGNVTRDEYDSVNY